MKRLISISLDYIILTCMPIFLWLILGLLIDSSYINIFIYSYPFVFGFIIIRSIFGTGANITKHKHGNKDAVMSGIVIGIFVSIILFVVFYITLDDYMHFMNIDTSLKSLLTYQILLFAVDTPFYLVLKKIYFEEKRKTSNIYSLIYISINMIIFIFSLLLFNNVFLSTCLAVGVLIIFLIYVSIKHFEKFKFNINVFTCIRFDTLTIIKNLLFFAIYFVGIKINTSFAIEYVAALSFSSLITDIQWNATAAIIDAAQIDLSKNKFIYKDHLKNAIKLYIMFVASVVIMFVSLYWFYDLVFEIVIIFVGLHLLDFIILPFAELKLVYIHLEKSQLLGSIVMIVSYLIRLSFVVFIINPYTTIIAQIAQGIIDLLLISLVFAICFKFNRKTQQFDKRFNIKFKNQ